MRIAKNRCLWLVVYGGIFCSLRCGMRRGEIILIPDSYIGWVRVYYDVPGEVGLPREGGKNLLRIDRDGLLRTSTPLYKGYGVDEYYYVTSTGERHRLREEGPNVNAAWITHLQYVYATPPVRM